MKFLDFCTWANSKLDAQTWAVIGVIGAILALFVISCVWQVPAPIDSDLSKVMR